MRKKFQFEQMNLAVDGARDKNVGDAFSVIKTFTVALKNNYPIDEDTREYMVECFETMIKLLPKAKGAAARQRVIANALNLTAPKGRKAASILKGYYLAKEIYRLKLKFKYRNDEQAIEKFMDDDPRYAKLSGSGSTENLKKIYKRYKKVIEAEEREKAQQHQ